MRTKTLEELWNEDPFGRPVTASADGLPKKIVKSTEDAARFFGQYLMYKHLRHAGQANAALAKYKKYMDVLAEAGKSDLAERAKELGNEAFTKLLNDERRMGHLRDSKGGNTRGMVVSMIDTALFGDWGTGGGVFRLASGSTRAATTFVQITKEDFEEWLDSTPFRGKWKVKPGTTGVYVLPLSSKVAVEISSSMSSRGNVVDYAKGSIQTRLVSLVTGKTINKKAQGQSHYKRTLNWRTTLSKGVEKLKDVYLKSQSFYDAIAEVEDREKYKQDILSRIETSPGWKDNNVLADFHQRVEQGMILSDKQKALMEKLLGPAGRKPIHKQDAPAMDENLLGRMRALWVAAKKANDTWLMDFTKSLAEQYKRTGKLSEKQMGALERNFRKHRVASDDQAEIRTITRGLREGDVINIKYHGRNRGSFEERTLLVTGRASHGGVLVEYTHKNGKRTSSGYMRDYGDRYGVQYQPSMKEQVRQVVDMEKL